MIYFVHDSNKWTSASLSKFTNLFHQNSPLLWCGLPGGGGDGGAGPAGGPARHSCAKEGWVTGLLTWDRSRKRTDIEESPGLVKSLCYQWGVVLSPLWEYFQKFPLTPMGVLASVSAQRETPLSPPSMSAEIFRSTCLNSNLQKRPKKCGGGMKFSITNSDQLSHQIREF